MPEKSTWEAFFDEHAPIYDENVFTRNTSAEADFLLDELSLKPGDRILDVGCGTGRHAVELAKRGCSVTGIDLSAGMLAKAAEAARSAGVDKAVLTALNGTAMIRRHGNGDVAEGRFDPLTMVETSAHPPREGLPAAALRERAFLPTELLLLFRLAGMEVIAMRGGTAGNWVRRCLDLAEMEIMVSARKTGEPTADGGSLHA